MLSTVRVRLGTPNVWTDDDVMHVAKRLAATAPLFAPRTISEADVERFAKACFECVTRESRPSRSWANIDEESREYCRVRIRSGFTAIGFTVEKGT